MAYLRGVGHGLAVGVVIGVLVAPRRGRETRATIETGLRRARSTADKVVDTASRGWESAQPAVRATRKTIALVGRAVQPAAQTAQGRLVELVGRSNGAGGGSFFSPADVGTGERA